jgi:hypothetical protein
VDQTIVSGKSSGTLEKLQMYSVCINMFKTEKVNACDYRFFVELSVWNNSNIFLVHKRDFPWLDRMSLVIFFVQRQKIT